MTGFGAGENPEVITLQPTTITAMDSGTLMLITFCVIKSKTVVESTANDSQE